MISWHYNTMKVNPFPRDWWAHIHQHTCIKLWFVDSNLGMRGIFSKEMHKHILIFHEIRKDTPHFLELLQRGDFLLMRCILGITQNARVLQCFVNFMKKRGCAFCKPPILFIIFSWEFVFLNILECFWSNYFVLKQIFLLQRC